jgi:hypothetical protein
VCLTFTQTRVGKKRSVSTRECGTEVDENKSQRDENEREKKIGKKKGIWRR